MASSPCLDVGVLGGACLCGTVAFWPRIKQTLLGRLGGVLSKALSGVPVSLKNLDITISGAGLLQVVIHGLTIGNVDGFKSENLAKIGTVTVVVDALKAAKSALGSCGKPSEVEVVSVRATECNFTLEKDSVTSSNFKSFLDKLSAQEQAVEKAEAEEAKAEGGEADEAEAEQKGALTSLAAGAAGAVTGAAGAVHGAGKATVSAVHGTAKAAVKAASQVPFRKRKTPEGMKVGLHHIDITGISMEVVRSSTKAAGKDGHTVKLADIKFDDFEKEFGRPSLTKAARLLIMKIMSNLVSVTESMKSAGHAAFAEVEQAAEGTWGYISSLFS